MVEKEFSSSNLLGSRAPDQPQVFSAEHHRGGVALIHIPSLDGLRGLAILLVLMHNLSTDVFPSSLLGRIVASFMNFGWVGVQLFFVLSGFLITRILLQTQAACNYYTSFFGRRFLRIFPLYYISLFTAFVIIPSIGDISPALAHDQDRQIWLWLYLSNWAHLLGFQSQVFPHFWSLAIEEQFYLLWPLVVRGRTSQGVLRLCFALAAVSFVVRVVMLSQGAAADSIYTYTICRIDALALGGAVAASLQLPGIHERLFSRGRFFTYGAIALLALGFVVTHGFPRTSPLGQTVGYSWLACGFAMAVMGAVCSPVADKTVAGKWRMVTTLLRTLGKYSYAMYVFHKPIHDWVGMPLLHHFKLLDHPSYIITIAYFLTATLATFTIAVASFNIFERHFLSLKRLFVARGPLQSESRLS